MRYNDPSNDVMDGWPTILIWVILITSVIIVIINHI
jgi:hypothetical protein